MRAPLNWLKRYVDIDVSAQEIQRLLTLRGLEVSSVEEQAKDIINVVVGKIVSIEKHPDADKLLVCAIDVGNLSKETNETNETGETIQIVTGAHNIAQGDLVPVALHGSLLPDGTKIKKGKLRGVESNGMLCSGVELNLKNADYEGAEEHGILILKEEYPLGLDIRTALGMDDTILEAEPTPNRPDCLSIIGIAREIAAALDKPLKLPEIKVVEGSGSIHDHVKIEVLDGDLCPRYTARTVKNIRIAPSPRWMQNCLRAAGVRAINNIVDITNFVMLEMGQPMHAFDLGCVTDSHIIVRRAKEGEQTTTLDSKQRALTPNTLLIADPVRAVGIAGIMGGENSEIKTDTQTVFFESAKFAGANIRVSAKALGLTTEASQRFSKGIDIEGVPHALNRAVQLVAELGAGEVEQGLIDVCPGELARKRISVRPQRVNKLLAIDVPAQKMAEILNKLEIPTTIQEGLLECEIPRFRDDIEGEADIAEEVGRTLGYDSIPYTLMQGALMRGKLTKRQEFVDSVRTLMCAQGVNEAVTYSFTGAAAYDKLGLSEGHSLRNSVKLINPFGEDNSLMRTTALVGMLPVIATNANRKVKNCRFFEVTNVHTPEADTNVIPIEKQVLCIGFYGEGEDFYTLKGAVERLCSGLDVAGVDFTAGGETYYHPGRKAVLLVDGKKAGELGEIHPDVAAAFDIPGRAYVAQIELSPLFDAMVTLKKYKALARFPSMERDLAVVVPVDVESGAMIKTIKNAGGKLILSAALFDTYAGEHIAEGSKSCAFALSFRADDRTLTDEDVSGAIAKILAALEKEFGAIIRQ